MKLSHKLKFSALGVALACAATGSSALTLGRASSAAILGRPLEVTVPVQLAADEESGGLCFEADVFYGDSRQDPSRVTVSSEPLSQGLSVRVRVSANAPVDEPIVTVYLRAACGRQATRRYVLLADLVSDLAPSVIALPIARPITNAPVRVVPLAKVAARDAAPTAVRGAADASSEKTRATTKTQTEKQISRLPSERAGASSRLSNKPVADTGASVSRRARLKLAAIDLTEDRDPTLKISSELPFLPADDLQKRSEAIALWRSLNASPEAVLRDGLRMQSMETDLKTLQELTSKNRQVMLDLAERLDRAESQRYANPLVYGLVALLCACGVGLAFGFFRLRAARLGPAPWWNGPGRDAKPEAQSVAARNEDVPQPLEEKLTTQPVLVSEPVSAVGLYDIDIDLHIADSAFTDLGRPTPDAVTAPKVSVARPNAADVASRSAYSPSGFGGIREISTEEMLDVRQQADFFMTLGQYDEAIAVLEARVNADGEVNPLIHLDLLKVFHRLSKKADYDSYRTQFNQIFSGNVPTYAMFNQQGNSLDAYPSTCHRIVELWPTLEAVEYLEKCLVRAPLGDASSGFDLEAFRDLLMLHGVARRLVLASDSGPMPFSALRANLNSNAAITSPPPLASVSLLSQAALPPIAPLETSVDLDLSEPSDNLIEFDGIDFSAPPTPK